MGESHDDLDVLIWTGTSGALPGYLLSQLLVYVTCYVTHYHRCIVANVLLLVFFCCTGGSITDAVHVIVGQKAHH